MRPRTNSFGWGWMKADPKDAGRDAWDRSAAVRPEVESAQATGAPATAFVTAD